MSVNLTRLREALLNALDTSSAMSPVEIAHAMGLENMPEGSVERRHQFIRRIVTALLDLVAPKPDFWMVLAADNATVATGLTRAEAIRAYQGGELEDVKLWPLYEQRGYLCVPIFKRWPNIYSEAKS